MVDAITWLKREGGAALAAVPAARAEGVGEAEVVAALAALIALAAEE